MKRKILIYILLFNTIFLSGCWDKIEINERGFILGMGIDEISEKEKQEPYDFIKLSFKVPNVALLGTKQSPLKESTFYFSGKGESYSTIIEEIESRAPFRLDVSHMKVIVIGNEILKNPILFRDVMDGIVRERRLSRKIYILAAREKAENIMKIKPIEEPVIGMYFRDILTRTVKEGRTVDSNLNNVARDLEENQSTVLPIANTIEDNKDANINGSFVIKDYKMVCELTDNETRLLNIITRSNEHIVDIHVQHKNIPITYDISKTNRKLKITEKNGNLVLDLDITTEGDIVQHRLGIKGAIANDEQIKEAEKLLEEKIKSAIEELIEKLQKDCNADVIGAEDYIQKYNPKLHEKVSKDWDQYFSAMEVNVKIDSKVRRIGIVR